MPHPQGKKSNFLAFRSSGNLPISHQHSVSLRMLPSPSYWITSTPLHWCFLSTRGPLGSFHPGEQTLPFLPRFDITRHPSLLIKGWAHCSYLGGTWPATTVTHCITRSLFPAYSQPCELLEDICSSHELWTHRHSGDSVHVCPMHISRAAPKAWINVPSNES